ncbi:MAG: hypothetical protein M1834_006331 [Cirrosporium novae-zelandiae]|nr:MAG: hypothetical protein M1834_006331 [Cirrosporium novae-zelandiae]
MDPHDAEKREFNERNIPDARITLTEDDKKLSIKAHGRRQESSSSAFSQDEDEESQTPPPPLSSRSGSIKAVTVRRSQRRGLFGRFTVIAEVEDAKLYPRSTKWLITFIAAMAAAAAPMGSGILFPSLLRIAAQFHTSSTVTNLSVALYMLSMSIFPLWWSSFSESLGRRTIYLVSFALYLVFNVLSAIANSIAMLIVMRMLAGGASASVQAVGAGTISDMFYPEERGRAMGIFYLGPLCGPLLAPIIGGALSQKWDWRATQWFLTIYGGIVLILVLFVLPETLKSQKSLQLEVEQEMAADGTGQATLGVTISRTSSRQIIQGNTKKWIKIFRRVFVDPLRIILYIRFPAIAILVCYASIT